MIYITVQILITQLLKQVVEQLELTAAQMHFIWGPNAIERGFYPFCLRTSFGQGNKTVSQFVNTVYNSNLDGGN